MKKKLLNEVSPHILYDISEAYEISYIDLMIRAGHIRPKASNGATVFVEDKLADIRFGGYCVLCLYAGHGMLSSNDCKCKKEKT